MKNCNRYILAIVFVINLVACSTNPPENSAKHGDESRTLVRVKPNPVATASVPESHSSTSAGSNKKHALLIGVGQYQPPFELEGPPNDVADLEQSLVKYWGFPGENITKLIDKDATKKNILSKISDLQETTQPGDEIFIYFSGHGTSSLDKEFGGALKLPYASGAIVPYGSKLSKDSLIIGKTDLRPLLSKLDQGNRRMLVVFDSCYSGNSVRSMFAPGGRGKTKARFMKMPVAEGTTSGDNLEFSTASKSMSRVDPYPYRNIVYMSAAQENETANDIPSGNRTFDGKAHGAFTDALLRILNKQTRADLNGDGGISLQEIYQTSKNIVSEQNWPQTPMALPKNEGNATSTAENTPFFIDNQSPSIPEKLINVESQTNNLLRVSLSTLADDHRSALTAIDGVQEDDKNPDMVLAKNPNGNFSVLTGSGDKITDDLSAQTPTQLAAWLQNRVKLERLLKMAKKNARFTSSLEVGNGLGGSAVVEGERFNFTLQTERPAYLLLLSVNAQNLVNILYPYNQQELVERNANQSIHFPGSEEHELIEATAPFGTDQLLLIAFDTTTQRPEIVDKLVGMQELAMDSPLMQELYQVLDSGQAQYAASSLALISLSRTNAVALRNGKN